MKKDHGGIRHEDLPWLITGIASAAAGMILMITGYRKSADELIPGGQNSQTIGGTILMAAGAVILIWLIVNDRKLSGQSAENASPAPPPRHITVPAEGFITAKIIGITRNLRMAGEREKFIIVCEFTEAKTGIRETFSSEPVDKYPGKEIIGKSVKVFLDKTDPGHYKVDLDSIR